MTRPTTASGTPPISDPAPAGRWQRWPCPQCGYEGRRFELNCPECDAPPWDEKSELAPPGPRVGSEVEVRSRGLVRHQFRFSTPSGFLGVLTRRFSGGGNWLGVDGREWRIDRMGLLGTAHLLRDEDQAVAGADAPSVMHGLFRGDHRILQGDRSWRLARTGLARHAFVLTDEGGAEVLRLRGGFLDPLRQVEVVTAAPMPVFVLASYLACGLRQGEGEV